MADSTEGSHVDAEASRSGVDCRQTSHDQPTHSDRPSGTLQLTTREGQVIRLICLGLSDKEIAAALMITPRTVRTHLERLFRRNGIHRRAAAVSRWLRAPGASET